MDMYKWKNRNKKYKSTKWIRIIRIGKMAKRRSKKYKIFWLRTRWKWEELELTKDKEGVLIPIEVE